MLSCWFRDACYIPFFLLWNFLNLIRRLILPEFLPSDSSFLESFESLSSSDSFFFFFRYGCLNH